MTCCSPSRIRAVDFPYGGDTWSGAESDKALADTIRKAGNVILLADATFTGEATRRTVVAGSGIPARRRPMFERRVIFAPARTACRSSAAALGHNFFQPRPRRTAPSHRALSCEPAIARCRLSDLRRRCVCGRSNRPADVRVEAHSLNSWRPNDAARDAAGEHRGRRHEISVGAHQFPRARRFCLTEEASVSALLVLRSCCIRRSRSLAGQETGHRSVGLPRQDRVRRHGRCRSVRRRSRRRSRAAGCLAFRFTHPSPTTSCRIAFMRPESRRVRMALVVALALVVGLIATLLPAWWATAVFAAVVAAFVFVATRQFAGRQLDQHHAADARVVAGVVRRRRLSVLLRRAREAEDEAAVRPVRLEGRVRAAGRESRSRAARRAAARR